MPMTAGMGRQALLLAWSLLAAAPRAAIGQATTTEVPIQIPTTTIITTTLVPNCLNDAVWQPHQRRMVTFEGREMPVQVGHYSWDSSRIAAEMYSIISREVLGINAEGAGVYSSSKFGFQAVAGCQEPTAGTPGAARCGETGPQRDHLIIECWDDYAGSAMSYIRANYIEKYPTNQGQMGFPGRDGIFVSDSSLAPALNDNHLPLEYYYSYSNPKVDITQYFVNPFDIPTEYLTTCEWRSATGVDSYAEGYYKFSGDDVGINVTTTTKSTTDSTGNTATYTETTYKSVCDPRWPHWWLSPSCRRNTSACIPFISYSYGWYVGPMMQRAVAWDIPVAITTPSSWGLFTSVPSDYKALYYWWFPDTTFIKLLPKELIWPPYDKSEWDRGISRTDGGPGPTQKWSYNGISNRSNLNFNNPLKLLKNMELGYQTIYDILVGIVEQEINTAAKRRAFACTWLNNNTHVWKPWIPEETNCREGEGLVDQQSAFVSTRGEASSCRWCTPGKRSDRLSDVMGITYQCIACAPGSYQGNLGMTACDDCLPGQAPSNDRTTCEFCALGRYASTGGLSLCKLCPSFFTTSNPGSITISQCICQEGRYRSSIYRDTCLGCPMGMYCKQGSDAANFNASRGGVAPVLVEGYWSSIQQPVDVYRCESKQRCPGGNQPGQACTANLESQGCSDCVEGRIWAGDKCVECPDKGLAAVIFPVLPIVLLPIVIIIVYKIGGDKYEKWGSWQNGIASMLFILLNHYQIVCILSGVDVMFPPSVRGLLQAFRFTSDFLAVFDPTCVGLRSFIGQMIIRCLGPLILGIFVFFTWAIAKFLSGTCGCKALAMDRDRTLNVYFALILTFFIALSEVCFAILKCASNPNNTSSVLMYRGVTCYQSEWNEQFLPLCVCSLVFWMAGFGAVFYYGIYSVPRRFTDLGVQMRWKFLIIRYRPDVHFWGLTVVVKSIILNAGFIFISSGIGQILWLMAIVNTYAGIQFSFRPWRHMANNSLDNFIHLTLTLSCACAIWFANDPASPEAAMRNDVVAAFFLLLAFIVLVPFLPTVLLMYLAQNSSSAMNKKQTELVLILDSFEQVQMADEEARRNFLIGLDESDFWFMSMAKDILQTEFAKRRCRAGYSAHKLNSVPLYSIKDVRKSSADLVNTMTEGNVVQKFSQQEFRYIDV